MEPEDFSRVKMDPDHASPSMADIDEFEDTGELNMPKPAPDWTGVPSLPQGWLLRIPKELWAGLADLPMDEEIHIGNVKVWQEDPPVKAKLRLEFNRNLPGWEQIPKEYDMNTTEATDKKDRDPTLKNTFIFSEKNMPGFKRNNGVDTKLGGPVKVEKSYKKGPRTIPSNIQAFLRLKSCANHCRTYRNAMPAQRRI